MGDNALKYYLIFMKELQRIRIMKTDNMDIMTITIH